MTQKVRDVMTKNPLTMDAADNVLDAAVSMRDGNIGDVIVTKDEGELCGILTDRDIVVRALAEGLEPKRTKLDDICSRDVVTVAPDEDVSNAVRIMREEHIRRIPVMENGKPVGIIALGDLAQARDPDSALGEISAAPPSR